MSKLLFLILLLAGSVFAQTAPKQDVWLPVKFFVGKWEGTGTGQPGSSTVEREYKFILNNKFLQVAHRSTYQPQPKNPKGEVHEDLGFFSYDLGRKQLMFRQFHIEGFVSGYVLTSVSEDGKTLIMTTESIENIPAGYKARETFKILNENEFTETFELSEPSKEFQIYSENRFKRKKS